MKLGKIFDENNIRIFTEFTGAEFKMTKFRPDMVIAEVDFDTENNRYGDCVKNCLCVIEFKYKTGFNASNDIYRDYDKMFKYVDELNLNCKLYMATIWECEDDATNWERKNASWANNLLTELNASYERKSGDMRFYIFDH